MMRWIEMVLLLLLPVGMFAHSLVVSAMDNEDGTMTIVGAFSTGESAAGALIRLEALASGAVLFEKRLPDESELGVPIPREAYKIVLDGGPGHQASMEGIAPKGGFDKAPDEAKASQSTPPARQNKTSQATVILVMMAFLLLCGTMVVSYRNTNKLLRALKQ
ncbi:MAG: hypothetical protein IBX45_14015 [Campylobacterales bacterium]|nr:hypothetical protein [Campylobacterales bacterium]